MEEKMQQFFNRDTGTPLGIKSSVHYKNTYRLDKAIEQASSLQPVDVNVIIKLVNKFLGLICMKTVESPLIKNPLSIDYKKIKKDYQLDDIRDIVWLKFTEDGYLGVVATSNDINFDIPNFEADYNLKCSGRWKHNTSGILVHKLNKTWNTSFVLVFPLSNIPNEYKRGDIERAIGNYLIHKNVPIIDFYSHNY